MDAKEVIEKLAPVLDERIEKANGQTREALNGVEKSLKSEIQNLTDKVNEATKASGEVPKAVQDQLDELQVKMKRGDLSHRDGLKTFRSLAEETLRKGENTEKLKRIKERPDAALDIELDTKAVVMESTNLTGDVIAADRRPGIIMPMERKLHMRDLLFRNTTTTSDKWDYTQETSFTDGTATVAEGAAIPKSEMTMEQKRVPVKKIAVAMDLSNEILEDIPGLLGYVQGRLRSKYNYKEDNQLLFGSGTGTDLKGVYTGATAFAAGGVKPNNNANYWDVLAVAATQMAIAEYSATAAVISVQDFASMALTKNANGDYILPILFNAGNGAQRILQLIVVPTTAMAQNNWLIGDFDRAAEIVDRRLVNISISTENKDNFERDLATIRLTSRLALPIYYPQGFVKGSFTGAGGGIVAIS